MNLAPEDIVVPSQLGWHEPDMNYFDSERSDSLCSNSGIHIVEPSGSYPYMLSTRYESHGSAALGWSPKPLLDATPLPPTEDNAILNRAMAPPLSSTLPDINLDEINFAEYQTLVSEPPEKESAVAAAVSRSTPVLDNQPLFLKNDELQNARSSLMLNVSAAKAIRPYSTGITPWLMSPGWVNQQLPEEYDMAAVPAILSRPVSPFTENAPEKEIVDNSSQTYGPLSPRESQWSESTRLPSPAVLERKTLAREYSARIVVDMLASRPQLLGFARMASTPSKCTEEHCNSVHATILSHFIHAVSQHQVSKIHSFHCMDESCPMAVIGFSNSKELQKHMTRKHFPICHACRLCPRSFSRNDGLIRHIRGRHADRVEELQDAEDKIDIALGDFEKKLEEKLQMKLKDARTSTINELRCAGDDAVSSHKIIVRHLCEERSMKVEHDVILGIKNIQQSPSLHRHYHERVGAKFLPSCCSDDTSRSSRRRLSGITKKRGRPERSEVRESGPEFELVKAFEALLADKRFLVPLRL